mgnify:CR=1 FL=1
MPEDIYKQDRFYVNLQTDEIIWMYHNPDAISGDQFVSNKFDVDLLQEAIRECPIGPDSSFEVYPIYDYIAENCRQYLSDVGMDAYEYDKELFESEPVSIAMSQLTLDKQQLLFTAKELIDKYCVAEFGEHADFSDLKKIVIAYTTTDDGKHDIQAYANLIDHRTEICLDGENIANQKAGSLKEYVENLLSNLDFNELLNIPEWCMDDSYLEDLYRPDLEYMQFEAWGSNHMACIHLSNYTYGGGIALDLYEKCGDGEFEPYSNITINLPDYRLHKNCAFVDTNNFPEAINLIHKYKLGKPTGNIGYSGYCTYPEYEFDMAEIGKYSIDLEMLQGINEKSKERNGAR